MGFGAFKAGMMRAKLSYQQRKKGRTILRVLEPMKVVWSDVCGGTNIYFYPAERIL